LHNSHAMRIALVLSSLAVLTWSCAPKCETASRQPTSVCLRADAGVAADQPFFLDVTSSAYGTCVVQVDAGTISISINATYCDATPNGADVAVPRQGPTACQIPALPAGTYTVASDTPSTFTVPMTPDAGLPTCP